MYRCNCTDIDPSKTALSLEKHHLTHFFSKHCLFRIRTVTLAFRGASVCVCLYGFASVQNSGHTHLRHPCLACPSRCIEPLNPRNHYKRTIIPSPRTNTLASLAKGRWIDGKTQALILLLSVCDTSTFFIHQTFLPSRRRDCLTNISSPRTNPSKTALSLENRTIPRKLHYPSPRTNTLASLVKGRWIDGKTQALILLLSVCDTSSFFIHQTFLPSRRRDCLTIISSLCTNHPKNRTIRQKELSVACYCR